VGDCVETSGRIVSIIKEQWDNFTATQRKVVESILEQPTQVLMLNLDDFAGLTGTSRATVLRVAQKLGFSGYRQLQQQVLPLMRHSHLQGDPLVNWLTQSSQSVIEGTISLLDMAKIEQVAHELSKVKMIIWYGVGESGFLAEIANHKCWLLGINSSACKESSNFEGFSHNINDSQAVVIISRTGNGHHIDKPLAIGKEKGIYTVGITSGYSSCLANHASICLFAPTIDAMINRQRISIRSGHELIINSLILKTAQILQIPFVFQ
jgi:DNA-binding MurR/RpiR family transcriptional regulator